jgi:opacity protein-like surface antigen
MCDEVLSDRLRTFRGIDMRGPSALAQEVIMRVLIGAVAAALLVAAPGFAQTERGYIAGIGGAVTTSDATSGALLGEVGVRIAPHLSVFGDVGQFHNLQPSDVQPTVDSAVASLSTDDGLNVLGAGRVPAVYSIGGVRFEASPHGRISPYVLGGVGFARLMPTARFTYSSGTLPDGSTPALGADVTSQVIGTGLFTAPAATTAAMFTLGGGITIPVAHHWDVDAGYRFSRVAADTPLNAQGAALGLGYRF